MLISEFTAHVLPDVQGCPVMLVERAILETIQDFCRNTWFLSRGLQLTVSSVRTTMNNAAVLDLNAIEDDAEDFIIIGISKFILDGVSWPLEKRKVLNHSADISAELRKKFYYFSDHWELTVFPMKTGTVYIEVAISPTLSATAVDDEVYTYWLDHIKNGAKARLLLMPGKQWTDLMAGEAAQRAYRKGMAEAKRHLKKSFTSAPVIVTPRSDEVWLY